MSESPEDELGELLAAVREDTIDEAQAQRLAALLRDDPDARRTYLHHMSIVANLVQSAGQTGAGTHTFDLSSLAARDESRPMKEKSSRPAAAPSGSAPIPLSFSGTHRFDLLGSAVFSYGLAMLLLAASVVAAWAWRLPNAPPRFADDKSPAVPARVAVITGATGCRWADASTAIGPGASVSAGRRFVLASGLLQIWYEGGVEVLLQGPAIYEVDSPHSGFLSLGRLTARVEKRPELDSREPTAPGETRRSSAPDFAIRTPSGTLTNQATMPWSGIPGSSEFGVMVDSSDVTRVHVFRGLVTARSATGPKNAPELALAANRSVLIAGGGRRITDASRKARMGDVLLARRTIVMPEGEHEQVAWLKAIGTGRERKFVAVGSGEELRAATGGGRAGRPRNPRGRHCRGRRARRRALYLPAQLRHWQPQPGHRHAPLPVRCPQQHRGDPAQRQGLPAEQAAAGGGGRNRKGVGRVPHSWGPAAGVFCPRRQCPRDRRE